MHDDFDRVPSQLPATQGGVNEPNQPAWLLFGRGFRQVSWLMPVCIFAGEFLGDLARWTVIVFQHPGVAILREQQLRDLAPSLVEGAVMALALSWLLANVRGVRWLYLCVAASVFLVSAASLAASESQSVIGMLRLDQPLSWTTYFTSWKVIVFKIVSGFAFGAVVLAALKIQRRLLFLLPFLFALWSCLIRFFWRIPVVGSANLASPFTEFFPPTAVQGVLFGLFFWAGLEFQRRKAVAVDQPNDGSLNKGPYVFAIACGHLLGVNLLMAATEGTHFLGATEDTRVLLLLLASFCVLAASAITLVFAYRAWNSIQSPNSTSPESIVIYLFIPVFNLFWIFRVFPGFATEYENYVECYNLKLPRVRRGRLFAFALMLILVPFAGSLASHFGADIVRQIAYLSGGCALAITGAIAVSEISDAVNRLPLESFE